MTTHLLRMGHLSLSFSRSLSLSFQLTPYSNQSSSHLLSSFLTSYQPVTLACQPNPVSDHTHPNFCLKPHHSSLHLCSSHHHRAARTWPYGFLASLSHRHLILVILLPQAVCHPSLPIVSPWIIPTKIQASSSPWLQNWWSWLHILSPISSQLIWVKIPHQSRNFRISLWSFSPLSLSTSWYSLSLAKQVCFTFPENTPLFQPLIPEATPSAWKARLSDDKSPMRPSK